MTPKAILADARLVSQTSVVTNRTYRPAESNRSVYVILIVFPNINREEISYIHEDTVF